MILDILLVRFAMVNKNCLFVFVYGCAIIIIDQTGSVMVIVEEILCFTIFADRFDGCSGYS